MIKKAEPKGDAVNTHLPLTRPARNSAFSCRYKNADAASKDAIAAVVKNHSSLWNALSTLRDAIGFHRSTTALIAIVLLGMQRSKGNNRCTQGAWSALWCGAMHALTHLHENEHNLLRMHMKPKAAHQSPICAARRGQQRGTPRQNPPVRYVEMRDPPPMLLKLPGQFNSTRMQPLGATSRTNPPTSSPPLLYGTCRAHQS